MVEPAKHCQLRKAVRDGEEINPSRYQTMTNDETYQFFRENCSNQVRLIMEEHSKEKIATAIK